MVGYNEIPPAPLRSAPQLLWLFGEVGYATIGIGFQSSGPRQLTVAEVNEVRRIRALFPEADEVTGFTIPQKSHLFPGIEVLNPRTYKGT